ncbi:unnamed protein product [Eruca vesicaria subsp. sativa]|uniref:Uncharacterized protein n=1 Tax=Eruca vesicaria subsp. sativa TaxID=29727 RepID=A0ABC8M8L0_ERUVS|nr:unnamed protein product [Eruca vesicaria subsp. sativa]
MMFASVFLWVKRLYRRRSHHHCLPLSDANYVLSLSSLVIELLRFSRLVELASVVVFGVIMFPLIGRDFPVCTPHITVGVFPSTSKVGDVFPVIEIHLVNLQSIGFCLLALRLNGYYRFQFVTRILKQPWPPPGFFSSDQFFSVAILRKGWAMASLAKENKGNLHDTIFAVKERLISTLRGIMITHEDSTKTSLISLGSEDSKAIRATGVFGTDYDVTDGSNPMIFLEKKWYFLTKLRATKKINKDQERSRVKLANQPILRMHLEASCYC